MSERRVDNVSGSYDRKTGRQCKGLVGQEVRKMCRAHMARMEDIAIHSYDGKWGAL